MKRFLSCETAVIAIVLALFVLAVPAGAKNAEYSAGSGGDISGIEAELPKATSPIAQGRVSMAEASPGAAESDAADIQTPKPSDERSQELQIIYENQRDNQGAASDINILGGTVTYSDASSPVVLVSAAMGALLLLVWVIWLIRRRKRK